MGLFDITDILDSNALPDINSSYFTFSQKHRENTGLFAPFLIIIHVKVVSFWSQDCQVMSGLLSSEH